MRTPRALLCIVVSILLTACTTIPPAAFNIIDFGARPNSSALSTGAINRAIRVASRNGGGTVVIPAGLYLTGPIELASNLTLEIGPSATLRFPAMRLPCTQGRVQGIECLASVPLIGGVNIENVTIRGRGLLTTDNAQWLDLYGRPQPKTAAGAGSAFGPEWNHLLKLLQQQTPQPAGEYLKAAPFLRPAFIRFMNCKNCTIEDVHIVGSPFWTIHALYSQNISIHGISVETFPGAFTGGIYIDSTRDVRISDSYLDNGDDAITLKAGKDNDGLRVNRPTENVAIDNCVIHRGSGAIVIGSETSGGIRNVAVSNIVCQGTQMGINIKSERGRGGIVENVRIDNMIMDDVGKAISVSEYYTMQGEWQGETTSGTAAASQPVSIRTPVFRDIAISHITIDKARGAPDFGWNPVSISGSPRQPPVTIDIEGLPEMPIANLRLGDITAAGKGGIRVHDTENLELHHVQMMQDAGAAYLFRDSRDLVLDDISCPKPPANVPVVRIEHCVGAIVRASRAFAGTGTFLSVRPGELAGIVLEGNVLGNAKTSTEESAGVTQ